MVQLSEGRLKDLREACHSANRSSHRFLLIGEAQILEVKMKFSTKVNEQPWSRKQKKASRKLHSKFHPERMIPSGEFHGAVMVRMPSARASKRGGGRNG